MIREIYPDLLIGNALDARNLKSLHEHRVCAVVDLALNEPPAQLSREMIYCRIPLVDGEHNSDQLLRTAIRCIALLAEAGNRTLVACSAGMSRAPEITAAAVAVVTQRPLEDCLASVVSDAPHDLSPALWSRVTTVYRALRDK